MDTASSNEDKGLFPTLGDIAYNIIVIVGLLVVILFVANFFLDKFFKVHLLTEKWYLIKPGQEFMIRQMNLPGSS